MHYKLQNTTIKYINTGAKTYEKVLMLSMASVTEVKVENFQTWLKSHITKQLLT